MYAHDIQTIRRTMLWAGPLLLASAVLFCWAFFQAVLPGIQRLAELSPAVRIVPLGLLLPLIAAISVMGAVIGLLRSLPVERACVPALQRAVHLMVLATFGTMLVIAAGSTVVQNHLMPRYGYTRCDVLQGSPSLWSSDWVRNPAWCQRGKTLEWVDTQARAAGPTR
jgi:hypothetical protein